MVKVKYIKPGHPLNIGDEREVSEAKAKFLIQAGMVEMVGGENAQKTKKVSKKAKAKKNTPAKENKLMGGVKSMLGFGKKKNKAMTSQDTK